MLIGAGKKNEVVNLGDTDAAREDPLLLGWQGREILEEGHLNETRQRSKRQQMKSGIRFL